MTLFQDKTPAAIEKTKTLSLKPLRGMRGPYEQLLKSHLHNRFPHALLLQGKEGIGKSAFAKWVAWQLLQGGCFDAPPAIPENCPLFHRMLSGGHGDFLFIEPEAREISASQSRQAVRFFQRKAMESSWRVAIINQAHKLNRFGANSLLKILEEPPAHCLLILVSGPCQGVLPTLASRCQKYTFPALSTGDFEAILSHDSLIHSLNLSQKSFLYRLADGSPGLAHKILSTQALFMMEDFCKTIRFLTHQDADALTRFVRRWESKDTEAAFSLFPTLISTWTRYLLEAIFSQKTDLLTQPERLIAEALKNRARIFQWVTTILQAPSFFKRTEVFHLDRGAIWYTFFLKLYLEASKWASHSTSRRLFTT